MTAGALAPSTRRWTALAVRFARPLRVGALVLLKLGVGAVVLALGFTHVSDDDYARAVIAEQFARAPALDPSGTSWLPFPFWIAGAGLSAFGRSLGAARAVAMALGAASVVLPYVAMRSIRVPRLAALAATGIAAALPWNAWLGVATVPEGWAGALTASAMIALAGDRTVPWTTAALWAASLSRYEAWPVCAVAAVRAALRARSSPKRRFAELTLGLFVLSGPALWMLWNLREHGSAVHFVARVTNFRRALGAADAPLGRKLLAYPQALAWETPEAAALGLFGLAGVALWPELRGRWAAALVAAFAVLAFLVWGDVRDGAPTHHPERALAATWWVLIGSGSEAVARMASAARVLWTRRLAWAGAASAALAYALILPVRWGAPPGNSQGERRDAQIARGLSMRQRHVASALIAPCAYEHFALLAAWGEPERARLLPPTHRNPAGGDCPTVVESVANDAAPPPVKSPAR